MATNSGPLSDRRCRGAPCTLTSWASTSITRPEPDAAGHVNRQTFAGPLVDGRQAFERLPIRTGVEHEVVRPHVVPGGRRQRPGPSRGHPAPGAPTGHLQPRVTPESMGPIGAHHVPLSSQEDPDPAIPIAGILGRQAAASRSERGHPAPPAATDSPRSTAPPRVRRTRGGRTDHVIGYTRPAAGARVRQPFFRVISLRTSISKSRSATIFFRRPFSCSSWRNRLTSGTDAPICQDTRFKRPG